jgi:hypothetical protein
VIELVRKVTGPVLTVCHVSVENEKDIAGGKGARKARIMDSLRRTAEGSSAEKR